MSIMDLKAPMDANFPDNQTMSMAGSFEIIIKRPDGAESWSVVLGVGQFGTDDMLDYMVEGKATKVDPSKSPVVTIDSSSDFIVIIGKTAGDQNMQIGWDVCS